MRRPKPPWFVRLVALAFVVFALLNVVGFFFLPPDQWGTARDITFNVGGITLLLAAGIGIFLSRKWGWLLALVAAGIVLVTGLIAFLQPADIAFPGADPIALVVLVLPSIAALAGLLAPQTMRWVRSRPGAQVPPPPAPPMPS